MATIYEFIVRDQTKDGKKLMVDNETGEVIGKSSVAKEKPLSGSNKGVDHNRYMRAVNPLINRYVPGFEKYVRGGRAIVGMYDTLVQTGITSAITSVGAIVLLELALTKLDDLRREKIEEAKAILDNKHYKFQEANLEEEVGFYLKQKIKILMLK